MKTVALAFSVVACGFAASLSSSPAYAGQVFAQCAVIDVATFDNRVHIHCGPPALACSFKPGGCPEQQSNIPAYVAVEAGSPMASTVVQVGLYALDKGHLLNVFFDDDANANPGGCNQSDCRRLIGISVQ